MVTVSCGTKFHSDYMADQLNRYDLLDTVVTSHPRQRYLTRVRLPLNKVKFLSPIFVLSHFIKKLLGTTNALSKWLDYKTPVLFDRMASEALSSNSNILITWAWSGLQSIKKIKQQGGIAIVEECGSCNLFQNNILDEEYAALGLKFEYPTPQVIVQRELEEVRLADYILCPSKHVAQSFINQGIAADKCIIIPYGVNLELFKPQHSIKEEFTVLFVGTVGVRKGLVYLFKALEILEREGSVKCIIIGKLEEQFSPIFDKYSHLFTYIEKVNHHELVDYYNKASVFVLPSLDEGMAYVQLEAMACGLPIICTPNSGGDSVVEDGISGFVVPIRQAEAIAEKIKLLASEKSLQIRMAENAQKRAAEFTWDNYGSKLANFIDSINEQKEN